MIDRPVFIFNNRGRGDIERLADALMAVWIERIWVTEGDRLQWLADGKLIPLTHPMARELISKTLCSPKLVMQDDGNCVVQRVPLDISGQALKDTLEQIVLRAARAEVGRPKPLTTNMLQNVFGRHAQGESIESISRAYSLETATVRAALAEGGFRVER
jgi:hypothetical protein